MSLDKVTRRQFNKFIGGLALLATVSPVRATEQLLSEWPEVCGDNFEYTDPTFYFTEPGNEQQIQKYLSKSKQIERKLRDGERTYKEKRTKTMQEWISQGILPDIKYSLSYSSGWAQALASLPFVSSEFKIDIIHSEDREDIFKIDTVKPDYVFKQKSKKGTVTLKEELTGNNCEYLINNNGITTKNGKILTPRTDVTAHSRVQSLYQNFREFLSTKNSAELPLFMANEVWPITVQVERIDDNWFSLHSIFDHSREKLLREGSFDKFRVKRVDLRVYMPTDSNIGIPDQCRMTMIKYNIDYEGKVFNHDHVQVYGKLRT